MAKVIIAECKTPKEEVDKILKRIEKILEEAFLEKLKKGEI